jgi:hypothetical protein
MDTPIRTITKADLLPYVVYTVNDALAADLATGEVLKRIPIERIRFVVWACGSEPVVVLVYSYLPGCSIDNEEAINLARDLLTERKWFSNGPVEPDFVL